MGTKHAPAAHGSANGSAGAGLVAQLKQVFASYFDDKVPRMAAALSYYTAFSVAPLLVIAIAIAGLVFGHEAAAGQISAQIKGLVGGTGAEAIETMVQHASKPSSGVIATIIGIITLLFGATGVFGELQDSLNTIWEVRAKPGQGVMGFLRARFLSFSMVFGVGFLLLVSLVVSAGLAGLGSMMNGWFPQAHLIAECLNVAVSFAVIAALFAVIFKLLPDVSMRWRDVWFGAAVTSGLFVVGKALIGLYLGSSAVASSYGSVGSLAVLLIWVYFSSQVFLIGAEFTKAHADASGSRVTPKRHAEWMSSAELAQQGVAKEAAAPDRAMAQRSPPAPAADHAAQVHPSQDDAAPAVSVPVDHGIFAFLAQLCLAPFRRRHRRSGR